MECVCAVLSAGGCHVVCVWWSVATGAEGRVSDEGQGWTLNALSVSINDFPSAVEGYIVAGHS